MTAIDDKRLWLGLMFFAIVVILSVTLSSSSSLMSGKAWAVKSSHANAVQADDLLKDKLSTLFAANHDDPFSVFIDNLIAPSDK